MAEKTSPKKKKKWDILFIAIALAAAAVLYFSGLLSPGDKGAFAVIYIDGEEVEKYPLSENLSETLIKTELGENKVVILDGEAFVSEADCPDKLCVKQGKISKNGETVVCLPHKLVVEIEGGEALEYDILSK